MAVAGVLEILLISGIARLQKDMNEATRIVGGAAGKIESAAGMATKALGALGIGLSVTAFARSIKGAIDMADNLGKLSQKVGIAVEDLSALKYAAELSDVSMEGLTTGLKKLSTNMFDAATGSKEALQLFKGLNVEFQSAPGKLKPTNEVLLQIADKFAKMEDGAGKSALAVKIFGKQGLELIPFLNQGRDGIERLKVELEKLGGVMTGEMAKNAETFNDNLKSLSTAANALKIEIANQTLPALKEISQDMKQAAIDAGLWEAALVGLRGAMTRLFETSDKKQLQDIQSKIAESQAKLALPGVGPNTPARIREQGRLNDLIVQERQLAVKMEFLSSMAERPYKPLKIKPDASSFSDKGKPKDDGMGMVGKQWDWWAEEEAKIMSEIAQLTNDFYAREREELVKQEELRIQILIDAYDREQAEAIANGEQLIMIDKSIADRKKAQQALELQGRNQFMSNMAGLMNTQSKKLFEVGKAFAIADALVKGYGAVMDAFAFGTKIGGPYLGAAFAAAAGIATLNMVNNIRSQQFGGGAGGGGGGGIPVSAGQGASGVAPATTGSSQTTIINLTGDNFSRKQVRELLESMNENSSDGGRVIVSGA